MKKNDSDCHAPDDVTCQKLILDQLLAYEDGSMPESARQDFRRHIDMCPPCVEFLKTYQATGKTLKMLKPRQIPVDLAKAVLSFVRARCEKEK